MTVKFKTLKSVRALLVRCQIRTFPKSPGWRYHREFYVGIFRAEERLFLLSCELRSWHRAQRRLTGKPAVIDAWLVEHGHEIRAELDTLTDLVDGLAANRLSDAQRVAIDDYRMFLGATWALDVAEPEEHELARMARPLPVPATEPADQEIVRLPPRPLPPDDHGWIANGLMGMTAEQRSAFMEEIRAFARILCPGIHLSGDPLPPLQPGDAGAIADDVAAWLAKGAL